MSQAVKKFPEGLELMRAAFDKSRLSHTLLLTAFSDEVLLENATAVAAMLMCPEHSENKICENCVSCSKVHSGAHPDLHKIGLEEDSKSIRIEQIREMIFSSGLKPMEAKRKVFIIEKAHLMNDVAQNAMLKTLEEPPDSTYFILCTSRPESLLSTIRSRSQVYTFGSGVAVIEDEDIAQLRKTIVDWAMSVLYDSFQAAVSRADLAKYERKEIATMLDELGRFFREALMMSIDAQALCLSDENYSEKSRISKDIGADRLVALIESVGELRGAVMANANTKAVFYCLASALSKA